MIVDWALYDHGRREPDAGALTEAVARARKEDGVFVWIGLYEPTDDEFDEVEDAFGLHPLAVEDAIKAHQRPKMERYGDSLFVVLRTARYVDPTEVVEMGEILCFLGESFIITVRHGESSPLSDVRQRLEETPELLTHGPGTVLYAVADKVVDDYAVVLRGLDQDVDEIEDQVFSPGRHNHGERIYKLKRETQSFRRAARPLGPPLESLAAEPTLHVAAELREYFRDVHDHVVRYAEHIAALEELLTSALHANLTQVSIRQNEDMRKISAWVAIAAVPTLIAGIYGMNFEVMPLLDEPWGYPVALGTMGALSVGLYRLFKHTGWL